MLETLQKIDSTDKVRMSDTGRQSAGNFELDWLSGLIDGEGSLMLAAKRSTSSDKRSYRPIASIANTHKATIERAHEILLANGVSSYICTNRDKRGKYPPQYSVYITGFKRMDRFLELMESRLFTKQPQAKVIRRFITSRNGGSPGKMMTSEEIEMAETVKKMNNSRYWWEGSSETLRTTRQGNEDMREINSGRGFRSLNGQYAREDKVQALATN